MLTELFPKAHHRFSPLPLLGAYLDGFIAWLYAQGYPRLPVRQRIRAAKRLDEVLRRDDVRRVEDLTAEQLLAYAPKDSQQDIGLAAVVRSLTTYLEGIQALVPPRRSSHEVELAPYRAHLEQVRGLAAQTVSHHMATAGEFLAFLGVDQDVERLRTLDQHAIERFVQAVGQRLERASLQHTIAYLRSFLRFLAGQGLVPPGLDRRIDTPRVYRGERLPRALSWELVQAFLRSIDCSTPMGRRDYAMFLMVITYGLRCCEVVDLTLDDIDWRARQLHIQRRKVRSPLILPMTVEVEAALVTYLRDGRPALSCREVFLRVRAPAGTLKPTAVTNAFQGWVRRTGLPIAYQGPHCLRHSLAIHLLRQGLSLKTIGDLLGHRSAESTCVYLRLQVDDLRDVAIELPMDEESEARP